MITQKMIDQWRAEDAQGNGIGAGDDDHQVFDVAEAVDAIRAEYPEMQVLATEALNGAVHEQKRHVGPDDQGGREKRPTAIEWQNTTVEGLANEEITDGELAIQIGDGQEPYAAILPGSVTPAAARRDFIETYSWGDLEDGELDYAEARAQLAKEIVCSVFVWRNGQWECASEHVAS